ncbi:pro-resilin-like [Colias croceus]|uniref:pro-resilin-like n=1 Tax=Colias crocea TaxID=72248 RepID=UPI001E27D465|nr:pro-resilin-like [Colias croceus]
MKIKVFIAVSMVACVLAEPPVGDSYSYADHSSQRSLSTQYGAPAFGSRSFNQGYSQPSEEYGVPARSTQTRSNIGVSQQYGTPKERTTLSLNYGVPTTRGQFNAARDISRQYIPTARSQGFNSQFSTRNTQLSQQYGAPETRNLINKNVEDPTQEYGVPALRSLSDTITVPGIPSDSYGAPLQRSQDIPSEQYGVPGQSFGSNKSPNFRSSVSQTYGAPRSNYAASTRYNSFNARSQSPKISDTYGAPARSLSTQYGAPSTSFKASSYQKSLSETYGAPNERSLSTEYGAPSGLNTNAFVSSYESARSSPSTKYGPPAAAREAMPSDQYGVPELNSLLSSQGYSAARNAIDELLNQEPASYDFGYKVNDLESGSDFGHTETRQDNRAEGSYFVVLPDGSKQVVEYEADERGFKPRISVEPPVGQGYDDNAADFARSGPY